jgi:hypothetical protein
VVAWTWTGTTTPYWYKSVTFRGVYETEWWGFSEYNDYAKDHALCCQPRHVEIFVANGSNTKYYKRAEAVGQSDTGWFIQSISDKGILVSVYRLSSNLKEWMRITDELGNYIGYPDRMKIVVSRGW